MNLLAKRIALLGICLVPLHLHAQADFRVLEREVQIHGFLSGGFAYSNHNNYLTMATSQGSFFAEAGLSISSKITDKLHVGAQVYDRHIGQLGKGKVYLDWALIDYRLKDWIGFRVGKVKKTFGLYTNTQDQEFVHTWALLPQSLYPADLRSVSIGHLGGNVYGNVSLKRGGSLSYEAFGGVVPDDPRGGYRYGIEAQAGNLTSTTKGRTAGFDVRWNTPIPGLMAGTSHAYNHRSFNGTLGTLPLPLSYSTTKDRVMSFYGEYSRGKFYANAEYGYQVRHGRITVEIPGRPVLGNNASEEPAWFVSGAYRFSKRVEFGSYYSSYRVTLTNPVVPLTGPGRDHIYDRVVTGRFDLTRSWDIKVEGHFMDGVGSTHGFYPQQNPQGSNPTTNMVIVRTSWCF